MKPKYKVPGLYKATQHYIYIYKYDWERPAFPYRFFYLHPESVYPSGYNEQALDNGTITKNYDDTPLGSVLSGNTMPKAQIARLRRLQAKYEGRHG